MTDLIPEPTAAPVVVAGRGVFRRVVAKPLGLLSMLWLALMVVIALLGTHIAPYSATAIDLTAVNVGPTSAHLLGTDSLGRDTLSRLIVGTRPSLGGVVIAVAVFVLVGLPLGIVAGYRGGPVDAVIGRVTDVLMSLPGFLLLLVVLSVFVNNQTAAMIALGILGSPGLIRVTRAVTNSVREELYISAARVFGISDLRILMRHVWPRIRSAVIVNAALFAGVALFVQSGLAFLGFGPKPPNPSWGGMIGEASAVMTTQPGQIVPPGLAIGLTVMALGLLGNAVRDAVSETWSHSQATLLRRKRSMRPVSTPEERPTEDSPLLRVCDLSVSVPAHDRRRQVVRSVSLEISAGETVGVVGESGCGKTLTSLGIIGALPPGASVDDGSIYLNGKNLTAMSSDELDKVRGCGIGYVSQDPLLALDPMYSVGSQLREGVRRHTTLSRKDADARVLELLALVKLPNPETIARRYPHQLSGGMAQRVGIALALTGEPRVLIADEPTTALDVTTQAEILKLIASLREQRGLATVLVTHDWGVVASLCDRAVVMYAGEIVESGPIVELFERPRHPYTKALLEANPHVELERHQNSPAANGAIRPLPTIPGEVPRPGSWGGGCAFAARCSFATGECTVHSIDLLPVGRRHEARCIHTAQVTAEAVEHEHG